MALRSISLYIHVPSIQLLPLTMTTLALWHYGTVAMPHTVPYTPPKIL